MASLYTVAEFKARFDKNGTGLSDERIADLLAVSMQQILAYAPVPVDLTALFESVLNDEPGSGLTVPAGHREAHFVQARNIHNATKVGPNGNQGDTFALSPFPLDWHVKQLLRPATGVPVVG